MLMSNKLIKVSTTYKIWGHKFLQLLILCVGGKPGKPTG